MPFKKILKGICAISHIFSGIQAPKHLGHKIFHLKNTFGWPFCRAPNGIFYTNERALTRGPLNPFTKKGRQKTAAPAIY